jgi:GxxExxY protein
MKHETLTDQIIGCIVKVHRTLGPGFVEAIYRRALVIELRRCGLHVRAEMEVEVYYEREHVGTQRLDLVVNDTVVLELKAVPQLAAAHYEQLRSYLRASGLEIGLLVNFGRERSDFRRVESPAAKPNGLLSSSPPPQLS